MDVHEQLLAQVRAAFEPGASATAKQAAAEACRMMLAVLDPTAAAASSASSAPSSAPAAGTSAPDPVGAFLDGIIGRYKHLLPDDAKPAPMPAIPLIPIPPELFSERKVSP